MSSFHRTTSPVLTTASQPAHQLPLGHVFPVHPSANFGHPSAWAPTFGQQAVAPPPRGRKRSRDEAAVNLDAPEKAPPAIAPVHEDEDEWEYGPGMVLIKKSTGYVSDAASQSGTWLEEKAVEREALRQEEALREQQLQAQERPSLRSHKSSRLDLSAAAAAPSAADSGAANGDRSSPKRERGVDLSPPTPEGASAGGNASQPVIDDFTVHLGIGWSRLSEDEHIQAAARGWARYIENHYPVTEPKILLESKGLESYLVEAREGYFLFAEHLRQGRLVSSSPQRALGNLKTSPPTFDGETIMTASASPRSAAATPTTPTSASAVATAASATASASTVTAAPLPADMDMDMI